MKIQIAIALLIFVPLFLPKLIAGDAPKLTLSEAAKIAEATLSKNGLSGNYYLVSLSLIKCADQEWYYLADYNTPKDFTTSGAGGRGEDRFIKIDLSKRAFFVVQRWFMPWKDAAKKEFGEKTYGKITEIEPCVPANPLQH